MRVPRAHGRNWKEEEQCTECKEGGIHIDPGIHRYEDTCHKSHNEPMKIRKLVILRITLLSDTCRLTCRSCFAVVPLCLAVGHSQRRSIADSPRSEISDCLFKLVEICANQSYTII